MAISSKDSGRLCIQKEEREESKMWAPLIHEISCLVDTLVNLDNDETKSTNIIAEHTERIKSALPPNPTAFWYPNSIQELLSTHSLNRTEIPLDVLELLVSSGFRVNGYCGEKIIGLHLAITNRHYNAARWLVQHGADCEKRRYDDTIDNYITPIAVLAGHRNAPLDLFDLLKTPKTLNGENSRFTFISKCPPPLHVAARNGHTQTVLHLIKLGASVNQEDGHKTLPLFHAVAKGHTELALCLIKLGTSLNLEDGLLYPPLHLAVGEGNTELALSLVKLGTSLSQKDISGNLPIALFIRVNRHTEHYKDDLTLFTRLIPESNTDILSTIRELFWMTEPFGRRNEEKEHHIEVISNMLNKLIQRLILVQPLSVTVGYMQEWRMMIGKV